MVTVTGKAGVQAYMAGIPKRLENVLRGAARAGGIVFADKIKALTPSDEVRANLRQKTTVQDERITCRIDVKPGYARSIAVWLEYGTSPHFISVDEGQRSGKSVRRVNTLTKENDGIHSLVIGGNIVSGTVFHPGARPFPAFRPALDTEEAEAKAAAQAYINKRVQRINQRVSSGMSAAVGGDE